MRISDWSSDVCSSDLSPTGDWIAFRENYNAFLMPFFGGAETIEAGAKASQLPVTRVSGDGGQYLHWGAGGRTLAWSLGPTLYNVDAAAVIRAGDDSEYTAPKTRSEEHTSELQSLMRISYAVFCLKKKTNKQANNK